MTEELSEKTQEDISGSLETSTTAKFSPTDGTSTATVTSGDFDLSRDFVSPKEVLALPFHVRVHLRVRKFYELHWPELLGALLAVLVAIGIGLLIAYLSFPYPQVQCTVKKITAWSEWSSCGPCGVGNGTKFRNRTVTFTDDTKNKSCTQTKQTIKCNAGPCCKDGFVSDSFLHNCYKVMPDIRSWDSARTLAGQLNGDLAVIDFEQKHHFLIKAAIEAIKVENPNVHHVRKFWIGLRCPNSGTVSSCMWTNGQSVTFTKLNNPFKRERIKKIKELEILCTVLDLTNASNPVWANDACTKDTQYRPIVEQNSIAISNCDQIRANITSCYHVINKNVTWEQAKTHGLVTIHSPEENSHIVSIIKDSASPDSMFWLGFNCSIQPYIGPPITECVVRDECHWIDGTGMTYIFKLDDWLSEVKCYNYYVGCLAIDGRGVWTFENCSKKLPYIVEEEPICDKLCGSSWSEWSDCVVPIVSKSKKYKCGPGMRERTIGYKLKGEGCPKQTPTKKSNEKCHVTCQKECKDFYQRQGLDFCYRIEMNNKLSFEQLKTQDKLITIETKEEFDYILEKIKASLPTKNLTYFYYIGLVCDKDGDYRFCRWINDQHSPLNYNLFNLDQPHVLNDDFRCVAIEVKQTLTAQTHVSYGWVTINCKQTYLYVQETKPRICYKFNYFSNVNFEQFQCNRDTWIEKSDARDHHQCPTVAAVRERLCPTKEACTNVSSLNFQLCYYLTSVPVTFNDFESLETKQNSLVVIDSEQKQHFLLTLLQKEIVDAKHVTDTEKRKQICVISNHRYFIGLQCYDTGVIDECIWTPLNIPIKEMPNKYHNFAIGQPNLGPNPDVLPYFCVVMNSTKLNGTWYSVPCNLTSCFMTEFGPQCDKFAIKEWENVTYKCAVLATEGYLQIFDAPGRLQCSNCGLELVLFDSQRNCPHAPTKIKVKDNDVQCCAIIRGRGELRAVDRYSPWCHIFIKLPEYRHSTLFKCNLTLDTVQIPMAVLDTFSEWHSLETEYGYNYAKTQKIFYPFWTSAYCHPNDICRWKVDECSSEFTFPADDYAFWEGGRKPKINKTMCAAVLNESNLLNLVDCNLKKGFSVLGTGPKTFPIVNRLSTSLYILQFRLPEQYTMPSYFTRRHDCSYYDFERNRTCFNCPSWIYPRDKHNCFNCTDSDQHWNELRQNFSYCYKVTEDKLSMVDAESWYEFDGGPIVPRYLATIRSDEEQNYIKSLLPSNANPHLIGIQCWNLSYDMTCFWRDATLLRYENFAVGEPDYFDVLNNKTRCAVLDVKKRGLWKAVSCNDSYELVLERLPICNKFDPWLVLNLPGGFQHPWEMTGDVNVSSVWVNDSLCPFVKERVKPGTNPTQQVCDELIKNATFCYWAGRDERSVIDRQIRPLNYSWFLAFGRDLTNINDKTEQQLIIDILNLTIAGQYLIGLYCVNEKPVDCKWMDGSPLNPQAYQLFDQTNPKKLLHCVVLNLPKQTWTSINCSQGVTNYILEYAPSCPKTNIKFDVQPLCPACDNINCHSCRCGWNMSQPIGCPSSNSPKFLGSCCIGKAIDGTGVCVEKTRKRKRWDYWKNKETKKNGGRLLVVNDTVFREFLMNFPKSKVYTAGICYKTSDGVKCYWPGLKRINSSLFELDKITLRYNKQPLLITIGSNPPKFVAGKFNSALRALFSYRKYDYHVLPAFYGY